MKLFSAGAFLLFVLCATVTFALKINMVIGSEAIYVRADGTVDPPSTPMARDGNLYILTGNIDSDGDGIIIERDNITLDGNGYILHGTGAQESKGIFLSGRKNVTIRNLRITDFYAGIELSSSQNNSVFGNNMTDSQRGIQLTGSDFNNISKNELTSNVYGIWFFGSSNNSVFENTATTNSQIGVWLTSSRLNNISGNTIVNNYIGMNLLGSSNNTIERNTFIGDGLVVDDSDGNVVKNNVVNVKPLVYLEKVSGYTVTDAGQVILVNCSNIRVENADLSNASIGLELLGTSNSIVTNSRITANSKHGVGLHGSSNNTIIGNIIGNNTYAVWIDLSSSYNTVSGNSMAYNAAGVWIDASAYNEIVGNNITNNQFGLRLHGFADLNNISRNNISNNNPVGIRLQDSSKNMIFGNDIADNTRGFEIKSSSNYNSIVGNTMKNNGYAIWLEYSSNNILYHNNLMDDRPGVYMGSSALSNIWDDGYPSGGNYWRYYKGTDLYGGFYQNETGNDCLGDTSHMIDANNIDRYPLIAPIYTFDVGSWNGTACNIDLLSDSTVSEFSFDMTAKSMSFNVSVDSGSGFCRITIPNVIVQEMWQYNYTVLIDNETPSSSTRGDGFNTYIFVSYAQSAKQIIVVPEFTSISILLTLVAPTLLAVALYGRKQSVQSS